jgi:hypothetical protein
MIVTTKVKMDIVRKEILPRIDAVQGDANTRTLELLLYAQGKIWTVPEGVCAIASPTAPAVFTTPCPMALRRGRFMEMRSR